MICNSANLAKLVTLTNPDSLVNVELSDKYYQVSANNLPSFLSNLEEKAAIVERNVKRLNRDPSGKGRGRGKGSGTGKSTTRRKLRSEARSDLRDIEYLAKQVKDTLTALSAARAAEVSLFLSFVLLCL